ncbi:MAG TPA: hypothetical protein VFH97_01550, partial [Gemmatimonadales bacterium]|nr:hypothetical protein [Gemmatimonadales bacterium]
TGTFPFPSESAQEMMIKRLTDDPQGLDAARPGVRHPAALQQVMDRALARMPRDRYASAVQFAHDAESAVAGWTGGAVPVAAGEAATQIIDAASSDGTIQLAPTQVRGTPGTVARQPAGPATPTTPRPITSPPMPRKKRSPALAIAAAVVVLGGGATAAWMLGAGGNGAGAGPDSLRSAVDTPVTTDTAGRVAGRQDSTGRTGGTAPIRQVTPDTSRVAPPAVDLAAMAGELVRLGRDIENAGSRDAAIRRATDLSEQTRLPDSLRARAAQIAAEGHDAAGNSDDACRMNARAIQLDRRKLVYQQARTGLFGCPR